MIRSTLDLYRTDIDATDGRIGSIIDVLFDDEYWTIRYMVASTGSWMFRHKALLAPAAVRHFDSKEARVEVNLTREQVENSPDIDTDKPVSRQHEIAHFDYYGLGYYWAEPYLSPTGPIVPSVWSESQAPPGEEPSSDPHLRSAREVTGYHVRASDGEIGHIDDVLFDDMTWMVRYLVVDTRNWLPGRRVLVAPDWIEEVSWLDRQVYVDLSQAAVRGSPEFRGAAAMNDAYELELDSHFGRGTLDQRPAAHAPARTAVTRLR